MNDGPMTMRIGQTWEARRTFTREGVQRFAEAVGDFGEHHVNPDAEGRVVVHGLYTASLATEIGGSINYVSRDMHFDFLAPVFSGDTIVCEATLEDVDERDNRWRCSIRFTFTNQAGETVATGSSRGVVFKRSAPT